MTDYNFFFLQRANWAYIGIPGERYAMCFPSLRVVSSLSAYPGIRSHA
jgi:hypothetical protein